MIDWWDFSNLVNSFGEMYLQQLLKDVNDPALTVTIGNDQKYDEDHLIFQVDALCFTCSSIFGLTFFTALWPRNLMTEFSSVTRLVSPVFLFI